MNRVDKIRALVRPICVIYSVVMISVLAFMAMAGHSMPISGVGADCVYTLLAIAGGVTVEWTGERGIQRTLWLIKTLRQK